MEEEEEVAVVVMVVMVGERDKAALRASSLLKRRPALISHGRPAGAPQVEVLYVPLEGQTGTGPALDAARNAARLAVASSTAAAAAAGGLSPAAAPETGPEPLQMEREAHRRAAAAAGAAGEAPPLFEVWALGADSEQMLEPAASPAPARRPGNTNRPRRGSVAGGLMFE
jgi:hypothetical protein